MDRVLITANCKDLTEYRSVAENSGVGLEIQAFAEPAALNNGWRDLLAYHKTQLQGFGGDIGLHGAFYDMNSASRDPEVVALTKKRYRQNLAVAGELGARYLVVHLNYLGPMNLMGYHADWHQRQIDFWNDFVKEVESAGIPVLLENSWENTPDIIIDVINEVDSPYLRTCLDVAHATLYSKLSFQDWATAFEPYLGCCHMNNHDGKHDLHLALGEGVINYREVLAHLGCMKREPYYCLELPSLYSISTSLEYLHDEKASGGYLPAQVPFFHAKER